ncbi:MAG: DUF2959 domain-containing protein [bacterium]|nr:DUF2959 domain-containing protein [bacterium]
MKALRIVPISPILTGLLIVPAVLVPLGCQSTYYSAWEKLGVHKRDILVDRVEAGREDQEEAKEQIKTTYEAFQELTSYDGGDLKDIYERLDSEYEASTEAAEDVSDRIESIEKVATAMFSEWESELEEIQNPDLRQKSHSLLGETRTKYGNLLTAMRSAESKMKPVLGAFKDQVLFLKHNLNAQAIASLKTQVLGIEGDVDALIANMQKSIDEADAFIESMSGEAG